MAIPYQADRHDIGILRQDGTTTVGFMFATNEKGKPLYSISDDEYLAQQQTVAAGYDSLPYEREIRLGQDDWSGGFGQEIYDKNYPNKYLESQGVDNRTIRKSFLDGLLSSITLPTIPTITDGGVEAWTTAADLTNWTEATDDGDSTVAQSVAHPSAGTYCARLYGHGVGGWAQISQTINSISGIKGSYLALSAYVWDDANNQTRIYITTDGTGGTTTYSSYHTGSSALEQLYCGVKIPSDATYITIGARHTTAATNYGYVDAFAFTSYGNAAPNCCEEFNSCVYFALGTVLLKINSSGTVSIVKDYVTVSITSLKKFEDGNLYIARGLATAYEYMSTAESFTTSTAAVKYFNYFEQLDATSPTLYGSDSANTVRSTTDPTNGGVAWSAATEISTSEWSITGILCEKDILFILKGNRPFYLDTSGNVITLTSQTDAVASTTGGVNSFGWQGRVYMPYGVQGLLEYDIAEASFAWRQPSLYGLGAIGQIKWVGGDDQYLYIMTNTSTTMNLLAGRYEYNATLDSNVWAWHELLNYASFGTVYDGIITSYISSKKYLLILSSSTAYSMIMPSQYGDVTTDSTMLFWNSTTYFINPWLHGEFKMDKKAYLSLTLNMGHTYNASRYITVYYQLVGDSSWTSLGNFTGSATSMTETKYFSSSTKPSSTMIRFKFVFVTNSTSYTPILNSYSCKAKLFPSRRNLHDMYLRVADGLKDRKGQPLQDKASLRATLIEAKDDATAPITWYDHLGNTKYGYVMTTQPFLDLQSITYNQTSSGTKTEEVCHLVIQEIKYS